MQEIYVVGIHDFFYHTDGRIDDSRSMFTGIGIHPQIKIPRERLYDVLVGGKDTVEEFGSSLAHEVNRLTFYNKEEVALYFQRPSYVPESLFQGNGLLGMSEKRFESPLTEEVSEIRKYFASSLTEFLEANARVHGLRINELERV